MKEENAASPAALRQRPLDWINIAFLTLTPLLAVGGTVWYALHYGVSMVELGLFLAMYLCTGLAVTGGYHRYYSHRTYDCSRALQLFYLVFGAAAAENSALKWASDHRDHHRFVDTDRDPYNILRGGLYAHVGWIFYKDERGKARYGNVPDLLKDPLVVWQDRHYLALLVLFGFALPAGVGALAGRPLGGLLWGGLLRCVLVQHMTFCINSLAHLYGRRTYSDTGTARDSWWLGLLTFGEGYHNFHHKFQADYRNGVRWYQFDLSKWWLQGMRLFGQAWRFKRVPEALILKARLEVQARSVERRLAQANAPERMWSLVLARVGAGRQRLEAAYAEYQLARLEHKRHKALGLDGRRHWRLAVKACRRDLIEARRRWKALLKAMNRIAYPSPQQAFSLMAALDIFRGRHF